MGFLSEEAQESKNKVIKMHKKTENIQESSSNL